MNDKLSRREFLKRSALVGVGVAAAPLLNSCAPTPTPVPPTPLPAATKPAAFDWMRFKGTTLNILLTKNPTNDALEKWIPEFEQMTGIKVVYENIPEQQSRQKLVVDMAGGGTIDAFNTSLHVEKKRFSKNGWYEKLNDYLKDPTLTPPDFDWEGDVFGASRAGVTTSDGAIWAIPTGTDVWQFWYRKDIFDAKGIQPPVKIEDVEKIAKALHSPPDMYGLVWRGLKNAGLRRIVGSA